MQTVVSFSSKKSILRNMKLIRIIIQSYKLSPFKQRWKILNSRSFFKTFVETAIIQSTTGYMQNNGSISSHWNRQNTYTCLQSVSLLWFHYFNLTMLHQRDFSEAYLKSWKIKILHQLAFLFSERQWY